MEQILGMEGRRKGEKVIGKGDLKKGGGGRAQMGKGKTGRKGDEGESNGGRGGGGGGWEEEKMRRKKSVLTTQSI